MMHEYWFTGLLVYGEVRVDDDPEPGRKGRLSCSAVVPPVRGSGILSRAFLKGSPEITRGVCHRPQGASPLTAQMLPHAAATRGPVEVLQGVRAPARCIHMFTSGSGRFCRSAVGVPAPGMLRACERGQGKPVVG